MITQEQIFKKYPDLYREKDLSPQETAMCYGLDVPEEWFSAIDKLSFVLSNLPTYGHIQPKIVAKQVKIKFGQLRFYYMVELENFKGERAEEEYFVNRVKGYVNGAIAMASQLCEGEPY